MVFEFLLSLVSALVTLVSSPVHAVILLVLTFRLAASEIIITGQEFLGLLLIVVYTGAVAILFLFVVMMLELDTEDEDREVNGVDLLLLCIGLIAFLPEEDDDDVEEFDGSLSDMAEVYSIEWIGLVLYTDFFLLLRVAGFVLLVALIGAVVLAVPRPYIPSRKEDLSSQLSRDPSSLFHVL